jgi:drug/metabolite transporter (DMT)-like permease
MIRNRRVRRLVALALIVLGVVLLLLAPSVRYGLIAFALGVVLELAGIAIERREPR